MNSVFQHQKGGETMTLEQIEQSVLRTANRTLSPDDQLLNACIGMSSEAGEVLDHLKKKLFQGHNVSREKIKEELGDVLFYVALASLAIGSSLNEVATINKTKLQKRYPNGFEPERSIER